MTRRLFAAAILLASLWLYPPPRVGALANPGRVLTNSGSAFGGLIAFNLDGSYTVNLTPNTFDAGVPWSLSDHPSQSKTGVVAFESNRDGTGYRIYTISRDGSGLRQVTTDSGVAVRNGSRAEDRYPVISPDGKQIAFLSNRYAYTLDQTFYDIYVVNADGTGLAKVSATEAIQRAGSNPPYYDYSNNRSVAWSADSTQLAFRGSRYRSIDGVAGPAFWEMIGKITVATKSESFYRFTVDCGGGSALDWSSDGKIAYSYGGAVQGCAQEYPKIIIVSGSGTSEIGNAALGTIQNGNGMIRFSPDGTRIMYFNTTAYGSKGAVTLINVDGTDRTALPSATGINSVYGAPLWWADDTAIPQPARFQLSPFPVNISNGGGPVQMKATLTDANDNVIVRTGTGWAWDNYLTLTAEGVVSTTSTSVGSVQLCANNAGLQACVTANVNKGLTAVSTGGSVSTPTGADVKVRPTPDTSVTFATVTTAGSTSAAATNASAAGTLPSGYYPTDVAYDISTSAVATGARAVCLQAPPATDSATFARMRILHAESGALVDRTILAPSTPAPDFTTKTICSRVNSLSPFLLATVNAIPTISAVANQNIDEDSSTTDLAVTIADVETPAASLLLNATSSNRTLVPSSGITVGGSGGARTIRITPAANEFGTTTITLTVVDALGASETSTFTVAVQSVNDLPTISAIADQTIAQGTSTSALAVTIADLETTAATLTLSGASSNTTLVPTAGVIFGGSGATRAVTVTPVAALTGSSNITVTVTDADGGTASTTFRLTVELPVPGAPTALAATNDGGLVSLSWRAPATPVVVTGYTVEAGSSSGSATTSVTTGSTATTFTLTLTSVGRVYIRVRATNSSGASDPSNEVSLSLTGVTSSPRDLAVSLSGSTGTFTWLAPIVGTVTSYEIEAGSRSGSSDLGSVNTGSVGTSLATGIPSGRFYVRVRARNIAGLSNPSNEVVVSDGSSMPPGTPRSFAASVSGSVISLSWLAPATGGAVDTYWIGAGSTSGRSDLGSFAVGNIFSLTTTVASGVYYLRVYAANSAGTGPPSEELRVQVGEPPQRPAPPTNLAATHTPTGVVLSWLAGASGGAPTGYVIDVGGAEGKSDLIQLAVGPDTTFTVNGPPRGRYYVRVRALNGAGSSLASNEIVVSVP